MGLLDGIMEKVSSETLMVSGGALLAGGVVGGLTMKMCSSKTKDELPEKWIKVGEIKELLLYPIKSMAPTPVHEAALGRLGLKVPGNPHFRDRVFAIINERGNCVSQKNIPLLAHMQGTLLEGDKLKLSYIKDPTSDIVCDIPTTLDSSNEKIATIYGEKLKVADFGDKVAAWLSTMTNTPGLRLVYHVTNEPQRGLVSRSMKFPLYRNDHTGTFQDETSYMVMTDESLAALNSKLQKPVSHVNFRPSIVLKGTPEPFTEDFWSYIRIGSKEDGAVLMSSRPCVRCKLTTIDPETATFREDGEPLATLYKMKRQVGDSKTTDLVSKVAVMGAHFGLFQGLDRVIRVGDPVYAALL